MKERATCLVANLKVFLLLIVLGPKMGSRHVLSKACLIEAESEREREREREARGNQERLFCC
jgi:hypothetical protein